jgi:hypothetical protein
VSTSAYYARRGDPPSARAVEGARLIASRELHVANYASLYRQFASLMRNGVDRAEVRDQGRHGWKQSPQR